MQLLQNLNNRKQAIIFNYPGMFLGNNFSMSIPPFDVKKIDKMLIIKWTISLNIFAVPCRNNGHLY